MLVTCKGTKKQLINRNASSTITCPPCSITMGIQCCISWYISHTYILHWLRRYELVSAHVSFPHLVQVFLAVSWPIPCWSNPISIIFTSIALNGIDHVELGANCALSVRYKNVCLGLCLQSACKQCVQKQNIWS